MKVELQAAYDMTYSPAASDTRRELRKLTVSELEDAAKRFKALHIAAESEIVQKRIAEKQGA